jgi:hypothetical protein
MYRKHSKRLHKTMAYLQRIIKNKWHMIYVLLNYDYKNIFIKNTFFNKDHPFLYPPHQMTISTLWWQCIQLELNLGPPTSQGSALIPSYPPLAKPWAPQARMHTHASRMLTYSSSIFDTSDWESKSKILSWNFYGRCKDTICTCSKYFIFFQIFLKFMCHLKSGTCKMCMADFQAWFWPWWWCLLALSFINKIKLIKFSIYSTLKNIKFH